jgi:hypothetical protein
MQDAGGIDARLVEVCDPAVGLIATSESRLDSIMDRAVSNAFRAWV